MFLVAVYIVFVCHMWEESMHEVHIAVFWVEDVKIYARLFQYTPAWIYLHIVLHNYNQS